MVGLFVELSLEVGYNVYWNLYLKSKTPATICNLEHKYMDTVSTESRWECMVIGRQVVCRYPFYLFLCTVGSVKLQCERYVGIGQKRNKKFDATTLNAGSYCVISEISRGLFDLNRLGGR